MLRHLQMVCALVLGIVAGSGVAPALAQERAISVSAAAAPQLTFSPMQMSLARAVAGDSNLAAFYGGNGLTPIFLGPQGERRRSALRSAISDMPRHGIQVARYTPNALPSKASSLADEVAYAKRAALLLRDLTGGVLIPARVDAEIKRVPQDSSVPALLARFQIAADPAAVLARAAPRHPSYLALQKALAAPQDLVAPADLPRVPEEVWREGMRGSGVAPLRQRLAAVGFPVPAADPLLYDATLVQAVAAYQQAAGLPDDGVAGPRTIALLNGDNGDQSDLRHRAIVVALERMRWMSGDDLRQRHVWVNIPEFSTTIVESGTEVFRTRSVMGKDAQDMRTPEFSEMMAHLVVNPSWNVPRSIAVRDYLPRLQANRHSVSHLDVLDRAGRVLSRDQIDFSRFTAASFPYRLRQKPSDENALGVVKFIFPNPWNIYLHDTPSKHLFSRQTRAESNGCIRIGDPVDLAHALLSRQTDDPQALFQRALDSGRETWLQLDPPVPVHIVYFTAWPDPPGRISLFPDIYGRDGRIWEALQAEGAAPLPPRI